MHLYWHTFLKGCDDFGSGQRCPYNNSLSLFINDDDIITIINNNTRLGGLALFYDGFRFLLSSFISPTTVDGQRMIKLGVLVSLFKIA